MQQTFAEALIDPLDTPSKMDKEKSNEMVALKDLRTRSHILILQGYLTLKGFFPCAHQVVLQGNCTLVFSLFE